jgi:hypothetical protein
MLPTWQWGGAALLLVAVVVGVALLAGESSDTVASPGEAPPVQSPATQVPAAASVAMPEAATEASSNPGEEPVDPEPQPAPQGLSQRAAAGDAAALKELGALPAEKRSVADEVALTKGLTAARLRELAKLEEKLTAKPKRINEADTKSALKALLEDPRTATDTLGVIAGIADPTAVDILYSVWTGTRKSTDATQLASTLVYHREVRLRASEALSVALDLRNVEECEDALKMVQRAEEFGDQRSLRLLAKLLNKRGCGPGKTKDCFACLRDSDNLKDAISATRRRAPPKF